MPEHIETAELKAQNNNADLFDATNQFRTEFFDEFLSKDRFNTHKTNWGQCSDKQKTGDVKPPVVELFDSAKREQAQLIPSKQQSCDSSDKSGACAAELVVNLDPKRIESLISRLGATEWRIRENATQELSRFGLDALPHLLKTFRDSTNLEVQARAKRLIRNALEPGFMSSREIFNYSLDKTATVYGSIDKSVYKQLYRKQAEALEEYASNPLKLQKRQEQLEHAFKLIEGNKLSLSRHDARRIYKRLSEEHATLKDIARSTGTAWLTVAITRDERMSEKESYQQSKKSLEKSMTYFPLAIAHPDFVKLSTKHGLFNDDAFMRILKEAVLSVFRQGMASMIPTEILQAVKQYHMRKKVGKK